MVSHRKLYQCRVCGVRALSRTVNPETYLCVFCRLHTTLVEIGPWVRDALCADVGGELWYETSDLLSIKEAKMVCSHCPVKLECLEVALANHEPFGIWGGTTPTERRRLLQRGGAA